MRTKQEGDSKGQALPLGASPAFAGDAPAKVSVLIRTHQRPQLLERAVESVRRQTYQNLETVVVEDGADTAGRMLAERFPEMEITYVCTGQPRGRAAAGNRALELATGEYCNFLDDDDILYPQHLERTMEAIRAPGHPRMAYAQALEVQLDEKTRRPKRQLVRYKVKPNRLLLCAFNYLPIQCVLFERSLFAEHGGFDGGMDALEDWDLWLRFAQNARLAYVPEVTSEYYTPYKSREKIRRDSRLKDSRRIIEQKAEGYRMEFTGAEAMRETEYLLSEYKRTGAFFYLRKLRDLILYRDA